MEKCLDCCPHCGATGNDVDDENYSDGQFCVSFVCSNCGITYYEFYDYTGTAWYPEEEELND